MISYHHDFAPPKLRAAIDRGRELLFDKAYASAPCWIAGGALRRFFALERRSSDIDLFFPNEEARVEWRTGLTALEGGFAQTFENENVERVTKGGVRIDLVKKFFPSAEHTIMSFDFTVACAAVTRDNIVLHDDFFIDLAARRLAINALPFPESTLWRMQKYIRNGYSVCPDAIRALAAAMKGEAPVPPLGTETDEPLTVMSSGSSSSPFLGID